LQWSNTYGAAAFLIEKWHFLRVLNGSGIFEIV
jgi:hypothetical protein